MVGIKFRLHKRIILIILVLFIALSAVYSRNSENPNKPNKSTAFIENKGQWDQDALFLARLSSLNTWVKKDGLVYDVFNIIQKSKTFSKSINKKVLTGFDTIEQVVKGQVINMAFENSNPKTEYISNNQQETYNNYFIGNDPSKWKTNVKMFQEVIGKDIYYGIDVRYYFDNEGFRYDLIIKPNANAKQIIIDYRGQNSCIIDPDGNLVLSTCLKPFIISDLFAYQLIDGLKTRVYCQYKRISNNRFGFNIGTYNLNYPLIIDPLVYSTFLGGNNFDDDKSVMIDKSGNAYIPGSTSSTNFPVTAGAYQNSYGGGQYDGIITKLNANGSNIIFSTYLGGNDLDYCQGIVQDKSGNLYVTGRTFSTNFPATSGAFQTSNAGADDGFLIKFNSNCTSVFFSTYIGGYTFDRATMVDLDTSENPIIVGWTASNDFPSTTGVVQPSYGGGSYDAFVTKFNKSGSALIFSSFIGGSDLEDGKEIAIDKNNNIYLCGFTYSTNFPTTANAFRKNFCGGGADEFIVKLNPSASAFIYSTYLGGNGDDLGYDFYLDQSGCVYTTGSTTSSNFPTTTGVFQPAYKGNQDAYITKLNATGTNILHSSYLGGSNLEDGRGVHVDANGDVYLGGFTGSSNFPTTSCAFQTTYGGGSTDAYITKIDSSFSTIVYSTFIGGSSDEHILLGLISESNKFAYATGRTWSSNFPTTAGSYKPTYSGAPADIFMLKLDLTVAGSISSNVVATNFCAGSNITVPFTIGCPFSPGNVFTAQLSDSNGSFSSPTAIGTLTGITSGNINVKIPPNVPAGTKYRIRVVASNPLTVGNNNGIDIIINPLPRVHFNTNDTIQCISGNNFIFTNASQIAKGTLTYTWHFGDGINANTTNSSHSYSNKGNYVVKLIAISDKSCIDSFLQKVSVTPQPIPKFSVNDSIQCETNNQFTFTNTSDSIGGITFLWKISNGVTKTSYHMGYSFPNTGKYIIKLIASAGFACIDSIQKFVEVLPSPKVNFKIDDSLQCLINNNFSFTNLSDTTGGVSNKWYFGDNTSLCNFDAVHKFNTEGNYTIKLVITSNITECQDSLIKSVRVVKSPTTRFDINDSVQCEDINHFAFYNKSDTTLNNISLIWDFGDGSTSTNNNPSHNFDTPGIYSVKLIVNAGSGCIDSVTKPVQVLSNSVAEFIFDTNDCTGLVVFNNLSSGATEFTWDFGDGNTSNIENPQHTFDAIGIYSVRLISSINKGCYDTISKLVKIVSAENKMYVPNVFTPNYDGINEVFKVTGWDYNCEKYRLLIYNRWGEKIYDSNDYPGDEPVWNGKFKKSRVSPGVYIYIILGKKFTKAGSVTVLY